MVRSFLTCFLALSILWLTVPAQAQNTGSESSLRRDIKANRARMSAVKKKLAEANRREKDLAVKLADTRKRKVKAEDELADAEGRLDVAQDKLRDLKMRIRRTSIQLLRAQHALEKRLKAIYMEGEVSYMAVLLQSDDFTDFLNQADYLKRIVATDGQLIDSVKKHKGDLDVQKVAARAVVIDLAKLRALKKDKVESLARLKAAQDDLYARLEAHQSKLTSRMDAIEEISAAKEAALRQLIRARSMAVPVGSVPRSAGGLIYPVRGPITSNFGYRVHPILGTSRFHSGLDFGVGAGVPIQAADNGLVIHAGWYGGYGNAVILDHGGGWTTLYAHASRLNVVQGQQVARGATVSFVGSTGMSTGPHLHFEVRFNGNPVDPLSRL